jgi:hypothetical protein
MPLGAPQPHGAVGATLLEVPNLVRLYFIFIFQILSNGCDFFVAQTKAAGVVGKPCKLFSIDLATVFSNHPHKFGSPVTVHWAWRPVPVGTYAANILLPHPAPPSVAATKAGTISELKPQTTLSHASKQKLLQISCEDKHSVSSPDDSSSFFRLGCEYTAYWEIRVVYNHQDLIIQREPLGTTRTVTRRLLERTPDWIKSSAVLQDLPMKATLEVFLVVNDPLSVSSLHHHDSEQFVAFEAVGLQLNHLPLQPAYLIGGDVRENSVFSCHKNVVAAVQEMDDALLKSVAPDLTIIRKFQWNRKCPRAVFEWKSKLVTFVENQSGPGASPAVPTLGPKSMIDKAKDGAEEDQPNLCLNDLPPQHLSLGYTMAVYVVSAEGRVSLVSEHILQGGGGIFNNDEVFGSEGTATRSKLRSWIWTSFRAELSNLHIGDTIVLLAKPVSDQANYPRSILSQCAVLATQCRFATDHYYAVAAEMDDGHLSNESDAVEGMSTVARVAEDLHVDVDVTASFAVHDSVCCQLPL